VAKHLKEGRLKDAIAVSQSKTTATATWPRSCSPACRSTSSSRRAATSLSREDLLDTVRRSIQRATALTANDLKKGVSSLATIGSTAPFVGLLGTVVGVINAFQGIAATGSGGIGAVSAGISEALVETALGLFVAIPAVWFYNYLTAGSSTSTSRWTTPRRSWSTTSSRRRRSPGQRIGRHGRRPAAAGPVRPPHPAGAMAMDLGGGGKGGVKSDINVTPLVDVMLVLLIIMMLVAPLLQKGVDVTLPRPATASTSPRRRTRRSWPSRPTGHVLRQRLRSVRRRRSRPARPRGAREQEGEDRPHQGRSRRRVRPS
jgi:biopolymer transport protein ExbB/TolQ